jgi:hypothetical protein
MMFGDEMGLSAMIYIKFLIQWFRHLEFSGGGGGFRNTQMHKQLVDRISPL